MLTPHYFLFSGFLCLLAVSRQAHPDGRNRLDHPAHTVATIQRWSGQGIRETQIRHSTGQPPSATSVITRTTSVITRATSVMPQTASVISEYRCGKTLSSSKIEWKMFSSTTHKGIVKLQILLLMKYLQRKVWSTYLGFIDQYV